MEVLLALLTKESLPSLTPLGGFHMLILKQLLSDFSATTGLHILLIDITGQILIPHSQVADQAQALKISHAIRTRQKTIFLDQAVGFALPVILDKQLVGTVLCRADTSIANLQLSGTVRILQLLMTYYLNTLTQPQFSPTTTALPAKLRPEIKMAVQYIHSHLNENITLAQISKQVFLSSYYFSKLFKKETGSNYVDYVNSKKIRQAQLLLQDSSWPIDSIAQSLGFTQSSYFSKTFKRITGVSPRQFQKQCAASF